MSPTHISLTSDVDGSLVGMEMGMRLGSGWVRALACSDSESADRRPLAVGTLKKRKRIDV